MSDHTHAHYLVALPSFAHNDDDLGWLLRHAGDYIHQHSLYSGNYAGQKIHILDDYSAVVEISESDAWYDHFHYERKRFRHVNFGPSVEERTRWQYETFTNQDYTGIQDLTAKLCKAARKSTDHYQPGSKPRADFLAVLELAETAHRRVIYINGAPVSAWQAWIKDRQYWLDRNMPRLDNPENHPGQRSHIADMSAMLAVAGPMPACT